MQDSSSLKHEKLQLPKEEATARFHSETARNNRIEALKVLAQALIKEIEALSETPHHEASRDLDLSDEVRRFEADLIRCALIRTGGRQRRAAHLLHMKVATLNAKIKRYNLTEDELIKNAASLRQYIK
jgi:DNA-binding NtrC family response regulator